MEYAKRRHNLRRILTGLAMAGASVAFSVGALGDARAATHVYFRCNASGWGADSSTRMRELGTTNRVAIEFNVTAPWMTVSGDDCELTQTDQIDGWGTTTSYYAFGRTGYVFQAPGTQQTSLVSGYDPHFKIRYPTLGKYHAIFDRSTLQLTIGSGPVLAWSERYTDAPWQGVAMSSDGSRLVSVPGGGLAVTSGDGGKTWTDRPFAPDPVQPDKIMPLAWYAVATSSNGRKLVGATSSGLYTSADYGVTWTRRMPTNESTDELWYRVASSADGSRLVAIKVTPDNGYLYTSTDSGVSWTMRGTPRGYASVASSADGTKLVAVVVDGHIYTSADSGNTWTERGRSLGAMQWRAVASSSTGGKLVAVAYEGAIYTSADSGSTWTQRGFSANWTAVTSSADGTRLAATTATAVHVSKDSGATWVQHGNAIDRGELEAIASSADGTKLVSVASDGYIHTSTVVTP